MKEEYIKYLKSYAWRIKKQEVFLERGRTCEKCMSKKDVQIHHLTYNNIYREKMEDLKILCKICHEKEHKIRKKRDKKRKYKWKKDRIRRTSDKLNNPKNEKEKPRLSTREEIQKRIKESKL